MKLSLAPVPYYWTKEEIYRFYTNLHDVPVDIVYLGENICVKRKALSSENWLELGRRLQKAGKEVVMTTQALFESDADLEALRVIAASNEFPVEANDMGAVRLPERQGMFVAGMHLNIYNPESLGFLLELGAKRWVMPLEMSRTDLQNMLPLLEDVEVEVFGYGRMPLAFSARCFTARHARLSKDECGSQCMKYPEGLALKTMEQSGFLVLNGPQVLSDRIYCLLHELPELKKLGVGVVRITPQRENTREIARLFAAVADGSTSAQDAEAELLKAMPAAPCNGFWHHQPAMAYVR